MGLISDGGVHSHIDHIITLAKYLVKQNIPVFIHITTDGRDTAPNSSAHYFSILKKACPHEVVFATVIGRYFSMDRDFRWERIQIAYDLVKYGKAKYHSETPEEAIENAYNRGETDEFIESTLISDYSGLNNSDGILMANFRIDRVRQIMSAFFQPANTSIQTKSCENIFQVRS